MSSARLFRPLARALQRQSLNARPAARIASIAPMSTKTVAKATVSQALQSGKQQPAQPITSAIKAHSAQNMTLLRSGMPQLVPFYFVNETIFGFAIMVTLIYTFSKYLLPQKVRLFAARLFVSKL